MRKTFLLFFIFFYCVCYSQVIEQKNFCKPNNDRSYFPLDNNLKRVAWRDTFYIERQKETKSINGKIYVEFEQEFENDTPDIKYLREENGIVYEYDPRYEKESIKFDVKFEKGHLWKTADEKNEYKIIAFDGKLETPICKYQNLLVIDAKMNFGHFTFYYSKGLGYVGATQNGKLVSYITLLQ